MNELQAFEASWDARKEHWVDLLGRLVGLNTHSDNLKGVDAERALLRPEFESLGFAVEDVPPASRGVPRPRAAHLVCRRKGRGRRLLLITHLDTVFPVDDPFQRFVRDGELLRGPGVGDIKGGVVTVLAACAALDDAGLGADLDLVAFSNSDEEVGSHSSRALLRELAADREAALGFEPGCHPDGESMERYSRAQHVVRRKGCGRFFFELEGVAAHSGGAHHLGVSAVEALARKVVDVHALTDRGRGVTTNVGLVSGGRSVNTVAPRARGEIDFRFRAPADGEQAASRIGEILERVERVNPDSARGVTTTVEEGGGVLWPPLVPTPESERLSTRYVEACRAAGFEAEAIERGGASDAAHAAAAGVPSICGLGPVSAGIHTDAEHTSVPALRAAVLAASVLLAGFG